LLYKILYYKNRSVKKSEPWDNKPDDKEMDSEKSRINSGRHIYTVRQYVCMMGVRDTPPGPWYVELRVSNNRMNEGQEV